ASSWSAGGAKRRSRLPSGTWSHADTESFPPFASGPARQAGPTHSFSRNAIKSAISASVSGSSRRSGITETSDATCDSISSRRSVTLLASLRRTVTVSPCTAARPVRDWPDLVWIVTERYWSLITFDGYRIESRISARLKRFDRAERSGPTPSPSLPTLWHLI